MMNKRSRYAMLFAIVCPLAGIATVFMALTYRLVYRYEHLAPCSIVIFIGTSTLTVMAIRRPHDEQKALALIAALALSPVWGHIVSQFMFIVLQVIME
jgi:hypothetical protein